MPLTPFHLGPALALGVLLSRRVDLPTLLVGSVIVDVRAALVVFGPLGPPVHGILTTFLGGSVVAALLAGAVLAVPPGGQRLLDWGRLAPTDGRRPVVLGAFLGVASHVLLDSLVWPDATPLFPLAGNPLLLPGHLVTVTLACTLIGLLALPPAALLWWRADRQGWR